MEKPSTDIAYGLNGVNYDTEANALNPKWIEKKINQMSVAN